MIRLILFLVLVALMATGLAWLADRPGELVVNWQGWELRTSVFLSVVMLGIGLGLAVLVWSMLRGILSSPASLSRLFRRRRQKQGLDALSGGLIAIASGDRAQASRYALQARRTLPNEPMTDLLRAQTAHLMGDRATARRIYESMTHQPETELLGLRGLFLEAEHEKEWLAARQFAERAVKLNPKLPWSVTALFELQAREGDLEGALETLQIARRHDQVDRATFDRRKAVLLTGLAQRAEENDMDRALALALEAHELAPGLVPAAVIAGRVLASKGSTAKAAAVLSRTWKKSPHPEIAEVYAFARPGDSPRDRLKRVKDLAQQTPNAREAPVAVAEAAIEAKEWTEARRALEPLIEAGPTAAVAVLMARIEGGERGDTGRMREWLARAVSAPRDPAWTADGELSDHWAPVSPVTGRLDAYEWKVPAERAETRSAHLLLEELVSMAERPRETVIDIEARPARAAVTEAETIPEPAAPAATAKAEPERATSAPTAAAMKPAEPEVVTAAAVVPVADSHPATEGGSPTTTTGAASRSLSVQADQRRPAGRQEASIQMVRSEGAATSAAVSERDTGKVVEKPRYFVPGHAPDDPGPVEPTEDKAKIQSAS